MSNGVVNCEKPVDSMDRYHEIKKVIVEDLGETGNFVIESLSLLNSYDFVAAVEQPKESV